MLMYFVLRIESP